MDASTSSKLQRLYNLAKTLRPYLQYLANKSLGDQIFDLTQTAIDFGRCEEIRYEANRSMDNLDKFCLRLFVHKDLKQNAESYVICLDRQGHFHWTTLRLPEYSSGAGWVSFGSGNEKDFEEWVTSAPKLLQSLELHINRSVQDVREHIQKYFMESSERNYKLAVLAGSIAEFAG